MKSLFNLVSVFLLIALFTACKRDDIVSFDTTFNQIEAQIWDDPEHAANFLENFPTKGLGQTEQIHLNLLGELLNTRYGYPGSPDSIMEEIIFFYNSHDLNTYAAKAYYVQGVEYLTQSRYFEAMLALKEAETRATLLPDSLPYKCLTSLAMGRIAETEYLGEVACAHYQKALDYATLSGDAYRIACCNNDIARTHSEYLDSISEGYFANALRMAQSIHDTILYYDILIQKEQRRHVVDSTLVYEYARFVVDSLHVPFYAHIVAEYLQNRGHVEEGQQYLSICSQDTANSAWSAENYRYLQSRQYLLEGHPDWACKQMEMLYLKQAEQMYRDGKTRAFALSQMYDFEREKNISLKLRHDKQRLAATISIILFILVLIILSASYYIYVQKQRARIQAQTTEIAVLKAQAAEEEANKEIDRLNMELEVKRLALRDSLKKRIEISQKIAETQGDIHQYTKDLPQWHREWLEQNTFVRGENTDILLEDFKQLYGDLLGELQKKYEKLTDRDLLFIALSILGLDVSDMCFILGTTDRTLWNRRQFIKQRIGTSKMDFEMWINKLRSVS